MTAILFDFNGTLFQDSDLHEQAWREFAKRMFGQEISDEEFLTKVHGRNNDVVLKNLAGKELSPEICEAYSNEKEEIYRELCERIPGFVSFAEDVRRFLDDVKKAGIPFNIATASPRVNVDYYIERMEWNRWLNPEKVVCYEGDIPGKPAPDFYLRAAAAIGVKPEDCIVFEDSASGIEAARRAGVKKIIGVARPGKEDELRKIPAVSQVITNFDEVDRSILEND